MAGARKRRTTYHHGDLEHALIEAAINLIARKGAAAFTLRELARRVGVSHAAVYRHFTDKSALLEAIATHGYQQLAARLRSSIAGVPSSRVELRLLRIGTAYAMFAIEQEPRFRVMTRPRAEDLGSQALEAAIDDAFGVLLEVAKEGVEAGLLKKAPPLDHAMRVYLLAYGYASLVLLRRVRVRPEELESYLERLLSPLLAALRTDTST